MTQSPRVRIALWSAIAGCLVAAFVSIPTIGDGTQTVNAGTAGAASPPPSTPTEGAPATAGGGAGEAPVSTPAHGSPGLPAAAEPSATDKGAAPAPAPAGATAAASAKGEPVPAAPPPADGALDPGPLSPPKQGEYSYRFENSTGDSGVARSVYGEPKRSGDVTTQSLQVIGGGRNEQTDVEWRPDGQYYVNTTFTQSGTSLDCKWSPALAERKFPMQPGLTWASESSCVVFVNGAKGEIRRTISGKVIEAQRIEVAGSSLVVWVYEWSDNLETPRGRQRQVGKMYFSPKLGLMVRSTGTMTQTDQAGKTTSRQFTRELMRLEPTT